MFRIVATRHRKSLRLLIVPTYSIEENPCMLRLKWILGFPFLLPSMGIGYMHRIAGINRDVCIICFEECVCCVYLTGIMLTKIHMGRFWSRCMPYFAGNIFCEF
jgi:hypothetical protein